MFATQLKELESRCGDIAQICRRVSITELILGFIITIPVGTFPCIHVDQTKDSWC